MKDTALRSLDVPGMTLADQYCAHMDLSFTIAEARTMAASERATYFRRWSYVGPHRSANVRLSVGAVDEILAKLSCLPA